MQFLHNFLTLDAYHAEIVEERIQHARHHVTPEHVRLDHVENITAYTEDYINCQEREPDFSGEQFPHPSGNMVWFRLHVEAVSTMA